MRSLCHAFLLVLFAFLSVGVPAGAQSRTPPPPPTTQGTDPQSSTPPPARTAPPTSVGTAVPRSSVIHDATGGVQSTVVVVPDYNAHRGYPYGYGYYPYPYPYYYHWEWTWMPDVPKPPMMTFKIRMEPKTSRVYVNGQYMGLVDDFDSTGQSLKLPVEAFRIRIVHPDGRACAVDVAPIDTSTKTRTILCAFPPQ